MRLARLVLILAFFEASAPASIFILAISKDGVVAVADSRFAFSDAASSSGKPLAYADGINKIIRFDSSLMVETGEGFIANERFDLFVNRFAASAVSLEPDEILPALIQYGSRALPPSGLAALRKQHLAVAKFSDGQAVICGYSGKPGPCLAQGYIQSSPTDFDQLFRRLPAMTAMEVAAAARASMQRYIVAQGKQATMGGEFAAVLLTRRGIEDLWPLRHPIQARTVNELIALVQARKLPVTLVPPATWADLEKLLESGPAQ